MTNKEIFDAVAEVDEKYIEDAEQTRLTDKTKSDFRKKLALFFVPAAVAASIILVFVISRLTFSETPTQYVASDDIDISETGLFEEPTYTETTDEA